MKINESALRQMVNEAIGAANVARLESHEASADGAYSALIRCIGYTLGGTYHVSFDTAARTEWRALYHGIHATIQRSAHDTTSAHTTSPCPDDIERAMSDLLPCNYVRAE